METSFCELKGKEVINITDGKRLGKIIDLVFDTKYGKVLGIVVPAYNKSWNIFKQCDDIFIPFNCICKFGEDAILVQIYITNQNTSKKKIGILGNQSQNNASVCNTSPNSNSPSTNISPIISNPSNIDDENIKSYTTPPPIYPPNNT